MNDSKLVAEKLLQAKAVRLSPEQPFTWASGWKSPIYCDNRRLLSFPVFRDLVKTELSSLIFEKFPEADAIAGVATAGIAWGAMVADQLKLPFAYVRPKPKDHGLGNQIEGRLEAGQKIVVVEDLVSTGKSSLQAVKALKENELTILGMVSIFNYAFEEAKLAFEAEGLLYYSLSDYPVLIELAEAKGMITEPQKDLLLSWRSSPAAWGR